MTCCKKRSCQKFDSNQSATYVDNLLQADGRDTPPSLCSTPRTLLIVAVYVPPIATGPVVLDSKLKYGHCFLIKSLSVHPPTLSQPAIIAPSLLANISLCLSLCLSLSFSLFLSLFLSFSLSLFLSLSLSLSLSLFLSFSLFLSLARACALSLY